MATSSGRRNHGWMPMPAGIGSSARLVTRSSMVSGGVGDGVARPRPRTATASRRHRRGRYSRRRPGRSTARRRPGRGWPSRRGSWPWAPPAGRRPRWAPARCGCTTAPSRTRPRRTDRRRWAAGSVRRPQHVLPERPDAMEAGAQVADDLDLDVAVGQPVDPHRRQPVTWPSSSRGPGAAGTAAGRPGCSRTAARPGAGRSRAPRP